MFGLTDKALALIFGGLSALLLAACAVLYIEANGFFWIDGLKDKLEDCERDKNELRAELKSISDAKNRQAETTKQNIQQADKGNREAEKIAERIEQAPTAPNCTTPPEIMGADL